MLHMERVSKILICCRDTPLLCVPRSGINHPGELFIFSICESCNFSQGQAGTISTAINVLRYDPRNEARMHSTSSSHSPTLVTIRVSEARQILTRVPLKVTPISTTVSDKSIVSVIATERRVCTYSHVPVS